MTLSDLSLSWHWRQGSQSDHGESGRDRMRLNGHLQGGDGDGRSGPGPTAWSQGLEGWCQVFAWENHVLLLPIAEAGKGRVQV